MTRGGRDLKAGAWTFTGNGFTVQVRCDQGARRRIEDAWVARVDAPFGGRPTGVFAVFDGLGGEPKGDIAARTASTTLLDVVSRATSVGDILPRLNEAVLSHGGYTTAVVATIGTGGDVHLAHVGDSGAFLLQDGVVRLLTIRDTAPNGSITDFLGNPRLRGHLTKANLAKGASLVLCTDGVDGIVGAASLAAVLQATSETVQAAMSRLYAEIHSLGAPDNATMVWVHRD